MGKGNQLSMFEEVAHSQSLQWTHAHTHTHTRVDRAREEGAREKGEQKKGGREKDTQYKWAMASRKLGNTQPISLRHSERMCCQYG